MANYPENGQTVTSPEPWSGQYIYYTTGNGTVNPADCIAKNVGGSSTKKDGTKSVLGLFAFPYCVITGWCLVGPNFNLMISQSAPDYGTVVGFFVYLRSPDGEYNRLVTVDYDTKAGDKLLMGENYYPLGNIVYPTHLEDNDEYVYGFPVSLTNYYRGVVIAKPPRGIKPSTSNLVIDPSHNADAFSVYLSASGNYTSVHLVTLTVGADEEIKTSSSESDANVFDLNTAVQYGMNAEASAGYNEGIVKAQVSVSAYYNYSTNYTQSNKSNYTEKKEKTIGPVPSGSLYIRSCLSGIYYSDNFEYLGFTPCSTGTGDNYTQEGIKTTASKTPFLVYGDTAPFEQIPGVLAVPFNSPKCKLKPTGREQLPNMFMVFTIDNVPKFFNV